MERLPKWADLVLVPLVSLALAAIIAALVIIAIGQDPWEAITVMVQGSVMNAYGWGYTLYYATNFMFTGLAVSIAFQASLFNIGGEGQATLGGLGVALSCLFIPWPHWSLALAGSMVAAMAFGAAWAFLPAWLQAKRGSHIVITTMMFNFIAYALMNYLLVNVLRPVGKMDPASARFPEAMNLPTLNWRTVLGISLLACAVPAMAQDAPAEQRDGPALGGEFPGAGAAVAGWAGAGAGVLGVAAGAGGVVFQTEIRDGCVSDIAELDRIDLRILACLQEDGRISNLKLAEAVALSPTAVLARTQRLQRDGYILGYEARLNPLKLGRGMLVFVEVLLDRTTPNVFNEFKAAVQVRDEIMECHMVAGGFDYLLKTRSADMNAYRAFAGSVLWQLPGVRETRTYAVMEEVKHSTHLNLG